MRKIFLFTNSPLFLLQHLEPIIDSLSKKTKLYIISSFDTKYQLKSYNCKIIYIPIKRDPSLLDFITLIYFIYLRLILRPNKVLSFTPKAGFINALTFLLPGKNIHYFTGQRWALYSGFKRKLFKLFDRMIINFSFHTYCDSYSQAQYISNQLQSITPTVIGSGSVSGVDIGLYKKTNFPFEQLLSSSEVLPKNLIDLLASNKKETIQLFGFVGRITRDKGIFELISAFRLHSKVYSNSYLILIGPNELELSVLEELISYKNIFYIDYTNKVRLYLPCFTSLVLPSYREGFGKVLLEAAACSVPSIATEIPGPIDFVSHMRNGYLIPPKDVSSLKNALDFFAQEPSQGKLLGSSANLMVVEKYSENKVSQLFVNDLLSR